FMKSMGLNEHDPILYSLTALNAGICWLALDRKAQSAWCLEKGYDVAMKALVERWNAFLIESNTLFSKRDKGLIAGMTGSCAVAGAIAIAAGPPGWVIGAAACASAYFGAVKFRSNRYHREVKAVLELVDIVNGLRRSLIGLDASLKLTLR